MSHPSAARSAEAHVARWVFPSLLVLLVQVALYLWMAPRGFDFTDESYYFHNYLHWREFTGTVTFFGAYFEWPFRAMGMSIAGIRILSLLLVLASGALLMHQVLRFSMRAQSDQGGLRLFGWYLIGPMASAMMYFGYLTTLRAPSYNLATLCAMVVSTACLLRTLAQQERGRSSYVAPLLYGVALGACLLSKATTSLILALAHVLFFLAVNRYWSWRRLLEIVLLVSAGFAINLLVLTAEFPGWLHSLREGIQIIGTRADYGMAAMLRDLSWELQRALIRAGPWLLMLALLLALFRRRLAVAPRHVLSLLTLVLAGSNAAIIASNHQGKLWLFVMAATAIALWSLELLARPARAITRADRSELALMALLFFLPLVFSFGTNMPVLGHSVIASVFAYCAVYLRLYRLNHIGLVSRGALAASVCLLCVPALMVQVWALTDVRYTYRQLVPLGEQDIPVALGAHATVLRVDPTTRTTLQEIAAMAARAGLQPGEHLLDFSGDGPGIIYALGANPLGTAWMIGGYPGSSAAAERVVAKLDQASIRRAWLLTSTNNPRRIEGWEPILARRIGARSHQLTASISVASPYSWDPAAAKTLNVQLWKPAAPGP
jgi:hypothetical protein